MLKYFFILTFLICSTFNSSSQTSYTDSTYYYKQYNNMVEIATQSEIDNEALIQNNKKLRKSLIITSIVFFGYIIFTLLI